jgi:hypothetical protein
MNLMKGKKHKEHPKPMNPFQDAEINQVFDRGALLWRIDHIIDFGILESALPKKSTGSYCEER